MEQNIVRVLTHTIFCKIYKYDGKSVFVYCIEDGWLVKGMEVVEVLFIKELRDGREMDYSSLISSNNLRKLIIAKLLTGFKHSSPFWISTVLLS